MGKLDHVMAKDRFKNHCHDLGYASICLHDDAGSDCAQCEPKLFMESMVLPLGMVVKFHDCRINGPELAICTS